MRFASRGTIQLAVVLVAAAAAITATACDTNTASDGSQPFSALSPNPLIELPTGETQLARVCARGRDDLVVRALCSAPKIDSIVGLQAALGLRFADPSANGSNGGPNGNPNFALLAHSISLVGRDVSAINPRAFVFTPELQRSGGYVVLSFTRGSPMIELAAQDQSTGKLTFYLLKFDLACEAAGSCTHGDLLTPAIERDWKGISLYDDEDLKNTTVDCRQCHQPDGPGTNPILRMQEQRFPWTHWFPNAVGVEGGATLLADFHAAHGMNEDYAGIPAALLPKANALQLEFLVEGQGFDNQPNVFSSILIETEVKLAAAAQPAVNVPRGTSATWQKLYDAAAAGLFIPPPYHDVKVTDPVKLAAATASYQSFLAGAIAPEALIDIRDVFLDEALPDMAFVPAQHFSGREILVQACAQCHNSRLDQTLSRARFDVTRLDQLSAQQKELARSRVSLPPTDIRHMPPVRFRTLPQAALQRVLEELTAR